MKKEIVFGCDGHKGLGKEPYLTRYTLISIFDFKLCIHVFHQSDGGDLHDHPWFFLSLILWGGYIEETLKGKQKYYPGMILFRRADHVHRLELFPGNKAITLVLMGQKERSWGFTTLSGWVHWKKYLENNKC